MRRGARAAACTGWRSGWRSRSTAPSAAEGRSSATGITPGRSRRRSTCGPAWSTCFSTSASTSAPLRRRSPELGSAVLGVASAPLATGVAPATALPQTWWRASDGSARTGHCGWKNTRLPRRDRTRLDSADVEPTEHPAGGVSARSSCRCRRAWRSGRRASRASRRADRTRSRPGSAARRSAAERGT